MRTEFQRNITMLEMEIEKLLEKFQWDNPGTHFSWIDFEYYNDGSSKVSITARQDTNLKKVGDNELHS